MLCSGQADSNGVIGRVLVSRIDSEGKRKAPRAAGRHEKMLEFPVGCGVHWTVVHFRVIDFSLEL